MAPLLATYAAYRFSLVFAWVEFLLADVDAIAEHGVSRGRVGEVYNGVGYSLFGGSSILWFDPVG